MCLLLVEMTGSRPPCLVRHPIPHFLRRRAVFEKNSVKQGATGFNPDSLPPLISVFVQSMRRNIDVHSGIILSLFRNKLLQKGLITLR